MNQINSLQNNSLRQKYAFFIFTMILIVAFNFFQATPLYKLFYYLQFFLILFLFVFYVLYFGKLILRLKESYFVLYLMFLTFFMPLYLTYRSYINFGQPVSYGLAATRNYLFIIIGIWLIYKFKTKKLNLQIIEKAFLTLAWASLVLQIFVIKHTTGWWLKRISG